MAQVAAWAVLAVAVLVLVGVLLGRVQSRSSCTVADPRRDLRMRSAFDEGNEGRPASSRSD